MLSFSRAGIAEALTKVPQQYDEGAYEGGAVQNFRNILVVMGDRPAPQCQQLSSLNSVLGLAKSEPLLRDEVYVQVMKQLIKNPTSRSLENGWELLLRLCKEAPPEFELLEFIRVFCLYGGPQLASDEGFVPSVDPLAKACLQTLGSKKTAQEVSLWNSFVSTVCCWKQQPFEQGGFGALGLHARTFFSSGRRFVAR